MQAAAPRPSQADLALLARTLKALWPLPAPLLQEATRAFHVRKLEAGEHLLRAGERASQVALVTYGLVREYYLLADGSDRTKAFVLTGELTGSLADLLADAPSTAFVVAARPTRVLVAPYAELVRLGEREPAWRELSRVHLERLFLKKARREYELLALDARARYELLQEQRPAIDELVSARHIASYLGITPVHLSRLRRAARARGRGRA